MLEATKERLHELVDALPASKVETVHRYLEALADEAFLDALRNAPEDDEPLTEEDLKAIAEAEEDIRQGRTTPWEEVKKELGL
ncbi:MAG: hypothetical protein P4L55_03840 [Syntrophobacteraceae bacterium]|nr:hypothetical protein [Syntrophobacteraceae bacterium]